jgi:ABC-type uncharacterized transport system substrate-binding protein
VRAWLALGCWRGVGGGRGRRSRARCFDFVVNLKTARELGITFPNEIMLQVTEAIQ